jgi:phosphoribosylformylglycinamidine synthase
MRPTVQVGDPFAEKLLLEATLELIKAGVVVGVQDMGAAGISCSTSEMSAKGRSGMVIDLDKVPLREDDMTAYEIMLSESQERMLFIIEKGKEEESIAICEKWDVPITQIGHVTDDGLIRVTRSGKQVCKIDADSLVLGGGAPQYDREIKKPAYLEEMSNFNINSLKTDLSLNDIFWKILTTPTVASKRWIYEQYDSQVQTNTVTIKGDAAVLRLKELPGKAIAVTTDCNPRYVYLNPYEGTKIAVAESARNVVCTGAKPVAITNCLNFGNPYDPEVYWQFAEAIRGMGDACRKFETPVTGGNVSFHNESRDRAVFPTPTIGMLGVVNDLDKVIGAGFISEGDLIAIIGNTREELGGSEYLKQIFGLVTGKAPILDLDEEQRLHKTILEAIDKCLFSSAHDISEGGIVVALAEKAIVSGKFGAHVALNASNAGILFGESQSRVIVSFDVEKKNDIEAICTANNMDFNLIGLVTSGSFIINDVIKTSVDELTKEYESAIPNIMKS